MKPPSVRVSMLLHSLTCAKHFYVLRLVRGSSFAPLRSCLWDFPVL
jgi:hypothetical protein